MKEKLQKFINKKITDARNNSVEVFDVEQYRAQAFGALMFLEENKMVTYEEVEEMWDKAWNEFYKIILDIPI